jgi:Dolichyl-phosphate-mannose-protein mannosyltransferase
VLSEIPNRRFSQHREIGIVLLLTVLAFSVRFYQVDFNSLSEDEVAKWAAIQEYRQGHFIGVNSEHPMLPKLLAWASLTMGDRWRQVASTHGWPSLKPEGWLRMPNVLFGAAAGAVLFLLCRRMMGVAGSFAASFFWAVSPLSVALNRLTKEETPLTFFTLLACYFYCRAQQADAGTGARRWYDLSAISFGLALASQYILHLLGLNALAWLLAGRAGLTRTPSRFNYKRFFFVLGLAFVLVNPVILSPANVQAILHWLHHDGVRHNGYDFDGTLYMNLPSRFLAGLPWFYYLWLLLAKTPIPMLAAVIAGSILLLRNRKTLASCFFISFAVIQLAGLSFSGAKWIRYSLPLLPFLYLAGGCAVHELWKYVKGKPWSPVFASIAAVILIGWPLAELKTWAPYYSFYLNSIGGGTRNITRYFAPDEVSEFDTREVAQQVCPFAPVATRMATARPMSMAYYLETCGRTDIQVVPLYDTHYAPRNGDLIILEPSRRFFETQRYFDTLRSSAMSHSDIRVGPVFASTVYLFDTSAPELKSTQEPFMLTQLRSARPRFDAGVQDPDTRITSGGAVAQISRRTMQ